MITCGQVCVVNNAGFVLNWYLTDLINSQQSMTSPTYPIDQSYCMPINTVPDVQTNDVVMVYVHAVAGETFTGDQVGPTI